MLYLAIYFLLCILSNWFLMFPFWAVFNIFAILVSPLLPFFAVQLYGPIDNRNGFAVEPRLPEWLSWFMTPDNSLLGDGAWKRMDIGHWEWRAKFAAHPRLQTYLGYLGWVLRNSAYGFQWEGPICATIDQHTIVVPRGDTAVQNGPKGKAGYCFVTARNPDGKLYWHLCLVIRITATKCFTLNLGWKLKTYAEDSARLLVPSKAMYVCSPGLHDFVVA